MNDIVIIMDDMHPLLEKIKEKIIQSGYSVILLHWKEIVTYDFNGVKIVFMDRMGELYPTYETQVFYLYKLSLEKNFKLVNDPYRYMIARNKITTTLYLSETNINIPKTFIITDISQINNIHCEKVICKPYLGACAEEIIPFYLNEIPKKIIELLRRDGMVIIQEFIYNPLKFIWRIDIVNGEIIQLNQRYSFNQNIDFPICNGSKGGDIIVWDPIDIPEKLKELVMKVYNVMGLKILGIDILVDKFGEFYLLEVNPEPDITVDFVEFPYKIAEYLIKECEGE